MLDMASKRAGDGDLGSHQRAWTRPEMVEKFAHKDARDFFDSERHFLTSIAPEVSSALDVGCASGRLIELLESLGAADFSFTGVDLVERSITQAAETYPAHRWILQDFLSIADPGRHDLVNATGVVQHEPRTWALVDAMIDASSKWVLFDAKVALIDEPVVDLERSYVTIGDDRLYFIVLGLDGFVASLASRARVSAVDVYGYVTAPNARTSVPEDVLPFASVGVLLTLDSQVEEPVVRIEIPDLGR